MARGDRRKCKHCSALFRPDPRNLRHQRYCAEPACRSASKAASQQRWLAKPDNQSYFRDAAHVSRVQAWRASHPGYARQAPSTPSGLQDDSLCQVPEPITETGKFVSAPLQEIIAGQPAVLIGLIAHIAGSPLQEDIAFATRRLLQLGRDILAAQTSGP